MLTTMPTDRPTRLDHIAGVAVFAVRKFGDHRGSFSETYNAQKLADEHGVHLMFVQDNQSHSAVAGTIRGLHFQRPPYAQGKLVRVLRGAILDIAVDLRQGSPTYAKHVAAEISAEAWNQIYVPPGFAHGFCTLVPDTEVAYKVTAPYAPDHEAGIAWDDDRLAIDWPAVADPDTLSGKDRVLPKLDEAEPTRW